MRHIQAFSCVFLLSAVAPLRKQMPPKAACRFFHLLIRKKKSGYSSFTKQIDAKLDLLLHVAKWICNVELSKSRESNTCACVLIINNDGKTRLRKGCFKIKRIPAAMEDSPSLLSIQSVEITNCCLVLVQVLLYSSLLLCPWARHFILIHPSLFYQNINNPDFLSLVQL